MNTNTNTNTNTNASENYFELKLTGVGFLSSLSVKEKPYSCVITARYGAKENPQELEITCGLSESMAQYLGDNRSYLLADNQPISFIVKDFQLVKNTGEPYIYGDLTKVRTISMDILKHSKDDPYLNFHLNGFGYADRIRLVPPKPPNVSKPFWAVAVGALYGPKDKAGRTYVDCIVRGVEAQDQIPKLYALQQASKEASEEYTILVGFTIGDVYIDRYENKDKELVPTLKGRMLTIKWAKADGNRVFFGSNGHTEGADAHSQIA